MHQIEPVHGDSPWPDVVPGVRIGTSSLGPHATSDLGMVTNLACRVSLHLNPTHPCAIRRGKWLCAWSWIVAASACLPLGSLTPAARKKAVGSSRMPVSVPVLHCSVTWSWVCLHIWGERVGEQREETSKLALGVIAPSSYAAVQSQMLSGKFKRNPSSLSPRCCYSVTVRPFFFMLSFKSRILIIFRDMLYLRNDGTS